MPKLYDRQANEWRDIADHLVEDAYKSGRFLFKKDAEVNVQLPDGRYGTVPAEKLDDVLQAGGTYDLAEERQARIEEVQYGGEERELEALFLAAGRGLTFGLSDVAAEKFGDYSEEELRKLEEYNPTVSTVGEIGGAVLPALFTLGGSAPVSGTAAAARLLSRASVVTPAGLAVRAGVTAERLTASGMAKMGFAQADNVANKMLRGGASIGAAAGVEGVIFGVGETFAEEELGRADRTAEQMLANITSVGLLSGGIGAAMGAGPGALTKAFQMFHGNRFSKGLGDKVAQFSDDLTAAMTSGDRATIAKFRDPEFLDRFLDFDKIKDKTRGDTESFVNGFIANLEEATKMASGSKKVKDMSKLVSSEDPLLTLGKSVESMGAIRGGLEKMKKDPTAYGTTKEQVGPLLEAVDLQIQKMSDAIEAHLKDSGQLPKGGKVVFKNGSFSVNAEDTGWSLKRGTTEKTPLGDLPEKDRLARAADAERKFAEEGDEIARHGEERAGARVQEREAGRTQEGHLNEEIESLQKQIDDGAIEPRFLEEAENDLRRLVMEREEHYSRYWSNEEEFARDYVQYNPDKADFIKEFSKKTDEQMVELVNRAGGTDTDLGAVLWFVKNKNVSEGFLSKIDDHVAAGARKPMEEVTAIPTEWGDLPATIFNQLDEFKKVLGTYSYRNRADNKVSFNASKEMNELYQSLRDTLENPDLFGAAANAQKAVNAPFHKLLQSAPKFLKKFGKKDLHDNWVADPKKIETFVKKSDEFSETDSLNKQFFEGTISDFQDFTKAAQTHYGDKFEKFATGTEAINKQWANFGELIAAQKELRHLSQTNDSSMSLLAGGAAYAIGGIPGAVIAAAANDIIRPGNAIRRRMVVHNMKSMMTKRIDKSVSRVTDRIMKNKAGGPQRASKVPSILALVGVKSTGDSNEDIAAEMQAIQQIASPDALTARIEKGTADLEDAPMIREELTNATIRQVSMLQGAAAKAGIVESDPLTGQQKITMSDAGKAEYLQVRDTLSDPIGVTTQALEDGTASRTMGRTFAQAFPILFQEFTDKLLGDIREEAEKTGNSVSYADNLQLSSFTGIPLSPTLNPGFIGAMQNVMKVTEQGRRPQKRVASLKESANRAILPGDRALT